MSRRTQEALPTIRRPVDRRRKLAYLDVLPTRRRHVRWSPSTKPVGFPKRAVSAPRGERDGRQNPEHESVTDSGQEAMRDPLPVQPEAFSLSESRLAP